ncbi:Low affinity sulfate transporter 3 [Senna tora]|uniref:Low affinity sulfate transporter 3 n=1 Tax=Senna tora TaxID=362788 RepID=A0A834XI39_9FABA|nr:Low affinity sulfate transporter 3 [Senna tora]
MGLVYFHPPLLFSFKEIENLPLRLAFDFRVQIVLTGVASIFSGVVIVVEISSCHINHHKAQFGLRKEESFLLPRIVVESLKFSSSSFSNWSSFICSKLSDQKTKIRRLRVQTETKDILALPSLGILDGDRCGVCLVCLLFANESKFNFRLGFLVDFLSHAALVGFMAGAAIMIGLQQLKGLLGITHFTNKTDAVSVLGSVYKSLHHQLASGSADKILKDFLVWVHHDFGPWVHSSYSEIYKPYIDEGCVNPLHCRKKNFSRDEFQLSQRLDFQSIPGPSLTALSRNPMSSTGARRWSEVSDINISVFKHFIGKLLTSSGGGGPGRTGPQLSRMFFDLPLASPLSKLRLRVYLRHREKKNVSIV